VFHIWLGGFHQSESRSPGWCRRSLLELGWLAGCPLCWSLLSLIGCRGMWGAVGR
jgi:hypothetical protein